MAAVKLCLLETFLIDCEIPQQTVGTAVQKITELGAYADQTTMLADLPVGAITMDAKEWIDSLINDTTDAAKALKWSNLLDVIKKRYATRKRVREDETAGVQYIADASEAAYTKIAPHVKIYTVPPEPQSQVYLVDWLERIPDWEKKMEQAFRDNTEAKWSEVHRRELAILLAHGRCVMAYMRSEKIIRMKDLLEKPHVAKEFMFFVHAYLFAMADGVRIASAKYPTSTERKVGMTATIQDAETTGKWEIVTILRKFRDELAKFKNK